MVIKGANKRICAWIECKKILVIDSENINEINPNSELRYNPRNLPYWEHNSTNVDNIGYNKLITLGNKVFIND